MIERSLVIDTDGGSDDAVALLMAALHPHADTRAVTTVAGNVGVTQATRNAQIALERAGRRDVPVHRGIGRPLLRPLTTARHIHGDDGMCGVDLPEPSGSVQKIHAVDALRSIAAEEPGLHTLVTLGPLTNVAAAVACEPAVALDPMVATSTLDVQLDIGLDAAGRGGTLIDHRQIADAANATIVADVDAARFKTMFTDTCRRTP